MSLKIKIIKQLFINLKHRPIEPIYVTLTIINSSSDLSKCVNCIYITLYKDILQQLIN